MRRKIASILITVIFSCNVFIIAGAALEKNHTEKMEVLTNMFYFYKGQNITKVMNL